MRVFGANEFFYLLSALRWTLLLSAVAFLGGGIGGFLVAMARISPLAPLRWLASLYIQLFQGTPPLMQLFLAYYGLAVVFGISIDPWTAVAVAFTTYAAAFLGEIWRGAIRAVPPTQWEAADCLALSYPAQLAWVVLPQAFRIAIPPTIGFLVQLIKGTSIASIIGFIELTRAGQLMTNVTFQPMTVYPVVAAMYFMICWPLSHWSKRLERRLDATRGLVQGL